MTTKIMRDGDRPARAGRFEMVGGGRDRDGGRDPVGQSDCRPGFGRHRAGGSARGLEAAVGDCFNVGGADDRLSHLGKNLRASAPTITPRSPMEFVIWVESRLAGKTLSIERVASVERSASGISPEDVGLTLAEGKTVLKQVQASIVRTQVGILDTSWRLCRDCHGQHRVKDRRRREIRTIFGIVNVSCRRYIRCTCRGGRRGILWPLGMMELKRNTPELSFLLAKMG
jgi:hypothetical protein